MSPSILSRSTIESVLSHIGKEGFLQPFVNRQIIKVSSPGACFELYTFLLVTGIEEDTVAHYPAAEDERGIVDDSYISVGDVAMVGQINLKREDELQAFTGSSTTNAMSTSLKGVP